jgi:predicted DCC family thiol-disulfide oxidoreductase YuxK
MIAPVTHDVNDAREPPRLRLFQAGADMERDCIPAVAQLNIRGGCPVGIDSMIAAYTLVNRGWMVAPLRVRMLRPAFQALYRQFASHRQSVSAWLGLKPVEACSSEACPVSRNPFIK